MANEYQLIKEAWTSDQGLSYRSQNNFPIHLKSADLLQDGANMKISNALFTSVLKGRFQKTKFLIDQGLNVNSKNDYGYNVLLAALHIDKDTKRKKMFRLLLQHDADHLARDETNDRDVLSWACLLGRSQQVVTLLTDHGCDLDLTTKDRYGLSCLHYATHSNNLSIIENIIGMYNKYQISVDIRDRDGMTPYTHARRMGLKEAAHLLLNEGCASPAHADNINFKTPREWSQIGHFERKHAEERRMKEEINKARVLGKLSIAKALHSMPKTSRSDMGSRTTERSNEPDQEDVVGHPRYSSFHEHRTNGTRRLVQSVGSFPPKEITSKRTWPLSNAENKHQIDDNNNHINSSTANSGNKNNLFPRHISFDEPDNLSMKSHKLGLNLLAMTSDKGKLVDRFHHSEFDKNKSSEYQKASPDVTNYMSILSDQTSRSYRQSVEVPPPREPTPPPVVKKGKSKVSSLAIVMGRGKSGRRGKGGLLSKRPKSKRRQDIPCSGRAPKTRSKHFSLPDIKVNDRAI